MKNIVLILFFTAFGIYLTAQKLTPLKNGVQTTGAVSGLDYDSATNILYIAGTFDMIDSIQANNIAAWDGTQLNTLGGGITGTVVAVKEMNGIVYAGGYFESINGITVNNIAQWNGTQWSALGNGLAGNNEVQYLAAYNNQLWAAGDITTNDDTTVNHIAVWNGSAWSFPNTGLNFEQVNGLKVINNLLYIFGEVRVPGSGNVGGGAAVYNGSNWQMLPYSTDYIYDLGLLNDTLTAASGGMEQLVNGAWSNINTISISKFFNYNGNLCALYSTQFSDYEQFYPIVNDSLGQPFGNVYTNNYYGVSAVVTVGNNLFAGGNFYLNMNASCAGMLLFNGSTWSNPVVLAGGSFIDENHYSAIYASAYDSATGRFYVGGGFLFAGNNFSPNVGYWDGQNWHGMGNGLNGAVTQLVIYNGSLYASGYFTASGTDSIFSIARWDGAAWQPVISADGYIEAMYVLNGDLYIGGAFAKINNTSMVSVAQFNGTTWQAVGGNILNASDGVSLLSSWQGNLVAAAPYNFTYDFPNDYTAIILQNGAWQNIGNGLGTPFAFYTDNGIFYAISALGVYTYSNNSWAEYSYLGGTNSSDGSYTLTSLNGQLLASIVSFNYGTYSVLPGNGPLLWQLYTNGFYKIDSNSYYIAGYFPSITFGNTTLGFNNTGVIKLVPPSMSLAVNADTVCNYGYAHYTAASTDLTASIQWYMPGGFPDTSTQFFPVTEYSAPGRYSAWAVIANAYGTDTVYLANAVVVDTCPGLVFGVKQTEQAGLSVFPNPASNQVYVQADNQPVLQIQVFDLNGNLLMDVPGTQTTEQALNVTGLAAGMYFITAVTAQGRLTQKLVIE